MKYFLILLGLLTASYNTQGTTNDSEDSADKIHVPYGKPIWVLLGVHNEHVNKDSLKIELIDNYGASSLIHKGQLEGWGMRRIDKKIKTGEYLLKLTWSEETGIKTTERQILIKPEAQYFSLNIELANDPLRGREHNAIYVDQYVKPLEAVTFIRNWNPSKQYESDTLLVPDYEVTNNHDSTLYGAYMRFSTSLSINWVQPHYIAFMGFRVKTDSDWVRMSCNAPRIEMDLKSGETGQTLKDMSLGCPTDNFEPGKTYKITINYMLNDRVFEQNKETTELEDNVYVEQTIYCFEDEFKIEQ